MLKNNETLPDEDLINSFSSSSKNKLGRTYNPGRPLAMIDRHRILELYEKGHKISHIARIIGVTHSCVSKIMSRFRRTGSMCPRSTQYKKQFDINNNCTKQIILTSPSGSSFSGESFTSRESLSSSTSLTPAIIHKPIPLKNLYTVER
uniref:Paired domain-containing protein n=1 Tax=Rhabditophanes sp. KR3021 TaxID=114890 RepID=A0AC35U4C8_9BILA